MAYDPEVPPSLVAQGIGGTEGLRWFALMWVDPIADVLVPGYISNAEELGMRPGDGLIYKDTNRGEWDHYDLIVLSIDAAGAATVAFPEVPEEALPLEASFDPDDAGSYAVVYKDGRQVRVDMTGFGEALVAIATQAEAEAGEINTKRMTPLRVFQGIAAYITGRAAKTPPVDADGIVITDSAASGAPKQVTWANIKATMFSAWGVLLAAATAKTTPVDADVLLIADSAASNATKNVTWANLKATVLAALGTTIAALTGKATPADADTLALSDSAAAGVGKSLTIANLKAAVWSFLSANYITPWVAYTPTFTGLGTPSAVVFHSRRVGSNLEVRGKLVVGTSTAVEARITMGFGGTNNNVTADGNIVTSTQLVGIGIVASNAAASYYPLMEPSVGYFTLGIQSSTTAGLAKALGSNILGAGDSFSFAASVPITGW